MKTNEDVKRQLLVLAETAIEQLLELNGNLTLSYAYCEK